MKNRSRQLYILAWLAYITFSMLAFPHLRITVMLFSIPLVMWGGWLYRYKGALATTALSIPYHYLLINFHSNDPSLITEAFNPFGIGSLMVFSLCTALLQTLKQRYKKLNDELEHIVAERTNDLRQLTDHLINIQYIDRSIISSGLLDNPFKLLESMQEVSELLYVYLKDQKHPEEYDAQLIRGHIQQCREQLAALINKSNPGIESTATLMENIQTLSERTMRLSGSDLNITIEGIWEVEDREIALQVHNIIGEAVTNAIRHAHASQITIGFKCEHGSTTIMVENNGDVFPSQLHEGMGLPLMRYRAMSIGGSLAIEGGADQKTRVICTVPHTAPTDEKAFPSSGQRLNTTP